MALLTRRLLIARIFLLAGILAWPAARVAAQAVDPQREYAVKAVFLFNFCQFTTWPPSSFNSPNSPIIIGILGKDPFDGMLDQAVKGESAGGRPIQVARLRGAEDARNCHVVFVPAGAMGSANFVLNAVRGRSILTVGETDSFLAAGGMIALIPEGGKIRLKMNLQAVRSAYLVISSKLLRLATR